MKVKPRLTDNCLCKFTNTNACFDKRSIKSFLTLPKPNEKNSKNLKQDRSSDPPDREYHYFYTFHAKNYDKLR